MTQIMNMVCELVIKYMIVFQVSSNFDQVKEILKIRCHIYILMKEAIILSKIHVTMKFSVHHSPPYKETNHTTLQLAIYYIQYYNRKSRLVQMQTLPKRSERNTLSSL